MNKVRKIKNMFITSFALFFLFNHSYKLVKGNYKANKILNNHVDSTSHNENIVAHRGFSGMYPENSIESIFNAELLECADMVEIDVRFTKNNIFVLHHDSVITLEDILVKIEDLELNEIDEDLIVNNYPLYNLDNLLYDDTLFLFKRFLNSVQDEEKIIRLSKILDNYSFIKPLILDIKINEVNLDMIKELNKLIINYKNDIYIQSDYFPFLDNMIKLYPDYKYLYIIKSKKSLKNNNNEFYGYTVKFSLLDKIKVKPNKLYLVYTINSNQKYLNLLDNKNYNNNMYVITDNPDYICAISENKKLTK